VTTELII